jgi:hypothetical protein
MDRMHSRAARLCQVCGLAVGSYEPAAFTFAEETIFSSRAARPRLAAAPGCRIEHEGCHAELEARPRMALAEPARA